MLVTNQVISRLDFCNSAYVNLPNYQLKKMQMILNKAARLVTGARYDERITPYLIGLHWLPIKARINYKICTLTHIALSTQKPAYLFQKINRTRTRLFVPRINTNYGKRSFHYSAPSLYNSLPNELKQVTDIQRFKKKLKTHLFTRAYDCQAKRINADFRV